MFSNDMNVLSHNAVERGLPIKGIFELTDRCNLHCKFCYVTDRTKKSAKKAEIDTAEWLGMIRQAADAGMLVCTFTGGDPFIRKDFEEIYCKAYDMGLRIAIFTNAILIGDTQIAYLRKRPPGLVSVSLYGASEESYRELCGNGEDFHHAMESIDALYKAGFHMEIKTLPLFPLLNEYETIGGVAASYHCTGKMDVYLGSDRDDPDRLTKKWRLPLDKINDALNSFYKGAQTQRPGIIPEQMHLADTQQTVQGISCLAGKDTFFISHDGRMMGCPTLTSFTTFPFAFGFTEAWASLHEMIKNAEACSACNQCPNIRTCPACPATRISETGSITQCSDYLKELSQAFSLQVEDIAVQT